MAKETKPVKEEQRAKKERPLSPHIQIYKPEFTSISSIFHRLSGVFNLFGLIIISIYIIKLAFTPECLEGCECWLWQNISQIFILLFIWSLYHHAFGGIRHLLLDLGIGFKVSQARIFTYSAIILSVIATLITWLILYGVI
jgi:succinate dehydrogenase / fumarate reductase cytochrome b subunit